MLILFFKSHLFPNGTPGRVWLENFSHRHKEVLTKRRPQALALNRAMSFTRETAAKFFAMCKNLYDELGLHNLPASLWNCDETGYSCDPKNRKIFVRKGTVVI